MLSLPAAMQQGRFNRKRGTKSVMDKLGHMRSLVTVAKLKEALLPGHTARSIKTVPLSMKSRMRGAVLMGRLIIFLQEAR